MEEVTQSASLLKTWAWLETNKKQVIWGATVVVALGLVIWFLVWRHGEQEVKAGEALSEVFVPQIMAGNAGGGGSPAAQQYLNVAARYPGYDAGGEAMLLGAADLFIQGKYDEAKADFERFVREHRRSPMETGALLGIASCLDAQHKTSEAMTAYKSLIDQHPNDPVAQQAKFALARLYESQNKPELARNYYEDLVRVRGSTLASVAGLRLQELYHLHPELAPPPPLSAAPAAPNPALSVLPASHAPPKAATNAPASVQANPPAPGPVQAEAGGPADAGKPAGKK